MELKVHPHLAALTAIAFSADVWRRRRGGLRPVLAASVDQHVSIRASDWPRNHCELVDGLSFPAHTLTEVVKIPWPFFAVSLSLSPGARLTAIGFAGFLKAPGPGVGGPLGLEAAWPGMGYAYTAPAQAHLCCLPAWRVLKQVECESGTARDFAGHSDSVWLCRFAPASRLLFTAAHNEILVWEVAGH
ncbi:hypothetical protein MC885_005632 [Smutsia gigantea]|nr:hypothetical protein MC885_005632 [Smutsia gigantea]